MVGLDIIIDERVGALWAAAVNRKRRILALECDTPHEEIRWGSIFLGRVETIDRKLDACWVRIGNDLMGLMPHKEWPDADKEPSPGDKIIVQAKTGITHNEPPAEEQDLMRKVKLEPKVTRLSCDITLPGRYLIYAPRESASRISRRVKDKSIRASMASMLKNLSDDLSGCILRAAAASLQTDILEREGLFLKKKWKELERRAEMAAGPELLMSGPNAVERILSDLAGQQIEAIEVAIMEHLAKAEGWCEHFAPDLMTKIEPVQISNAVEDFALFHHYDLEEQIEELLQPYILLEGGANLIFQETAALTAVDVNRGVDQTSSNLELNIQAAREIARQIRLRNMGGIVIIDFLRSQGKMLKKDQGALLSAMRDAVEDDACTVQVHDFTALGLMEITRQRRLPSLRDRVRGLK